MAHSIVVDGEMLVWDPVTERNLPFGTLKTAARGKNYFMNSFSHLTSCQITQRQTSTLDRAVSLPFVISSVRLTLCILVKVFDLLYLNGQSLIHKPLSFRKRNLRHCITEVTGRIEYTAEYKGKTAKDIRERMDDIMAARGEGLIIKHPLSKYVLNGRNMDWIKVGDCYEC